MGGIALLILAEPVEPAAPEPSHAEPGLGQRENPEPGGTARKEHGRAWRPRGPAPQQNPWGFRPWSSG